VKRQATQPVHWLSAASYGVTKDSVAIALGDLRGVRKDLGALDISLSSSALVGLDRVFEGLIAYPYGCTEQLASRVLPILSAPELAAQQNVEVPKGRIDWVDEAIGQIANRQRYDGAFGYWEGDNNEVPWLSAYALLALERASREGYFVPRSVRDRSANYLSQKLAELLEASKRFRDRSAEATEAEAEAEEDTPSTADSFGPHRLSPDEQHELRLAQAVFIADVLSSIGQTPKSELFELTSFREDLSLS
jgi:uncharacterized protein YfaS (alpha-2-macroglobulin family)